MKIDNLNWDDENIEHIISKHGVTPAEVEDVCFGRHVAYSGENEDILFMGRQTMVDI